MGVLPAALGRNAGHRAFQDFQQRLLHAFAAYVPGDGGVLALAGDLVDFINVDDAPLRLLNVIIRVLNQPQEDVLHILANVARFRQAGGVGNGKGHVEDLGQGLGQEGFAAAGGTHQEDIGLLQFHILIGIGGADAFIVVVHRHAQGALGRLLPHHVLIQHGLHFRGLGELLGVVVLRRHDHVIGDDLLAQQNALIANVNIGTRHQPAHLILGFAAEAAPVHRGRGPGRKFVLGHCVTSLFTDWSWSGVDRFHQ